MKNGGRNEASLGGVTEGGGVNWKCRCHRHACLFACSVVNRCLTHERSLSVILFLTRSVILSWRFSVLPFSGRGIFGHVFGNRRAFCTWLWGWQGIFVVLLGQFWPPSLTPSHQNFKDEEIIVDRLIEISVVIPIAAAIEFKPSLKTPQYKAETDEFVKLNNQRPLSAKK